MNVIEYDLNGRTAAFDADRVYAHVASGELHLLQSDKRLRPLSPDEKAAYEAATKKGRRKR